MSERARGDRKKSKIHPLTCVPVSKASQPIKQKACIIRTKPHI